MKLFLSLFLIIGWSAFAGSVRIINDTAYTLTAEIQSADGNKKGSITIQPHANATWQEAAEGASVWSQTPYTVTFICTKSGNQYGIIDGVQQAATIQASMASGPRICRTPKKKGEDQQKQQQSGDSNGSPTQQQQNQTQQWESLEPPGDPNWGPP